MRSFSFIISWEAVILSLGSPDFVRVRRARTGMVCCARTPNLEIAFFSGDFLPAGGAKRCRAKRGRRVGPFRPYGAPPLNLRFMGGMRLFLRITGKGVTALCLFRPNLPTLWLMGVRACVMPIAAVRLRRMPELKKLPFARQFMPGARRNPCLQRGFDEATHERVAQSTERGILPA